MSALSALGVGAGIALLCAGSAEQTAEAGGAALPLFASGPGGPDGGAMSSFVARAQRGEVTAPDLDDIEHMCALLTSCEKLPIPPALVPGDFASCVRKMSEDMASPAAVLSSLTLRECGLQSSSCSTLQQCALHGAPAEACRGRGRQSPVGFCDVDGRAITCWNDAVLAVRDCPRGGEQCIVAGGEAKCTLGSCPAEQGDKARCSASGTHILKCEHGKLASLDCAAFGLKCTTAVDGTAQCATGGAACSGSTKRCEGNVAVGCFNGHEVKVDCASAAGLACSAGGGGGTPVGACLAPAPASGSACDSGDSAKCDGASIKYCYAGKPRSYFCKALGFSKCESGKSVRCAR